MEEEKLYYKALADRIIARARLEKFPIQKAIVRILIQEKAMKIGQLRELVCQEVSRINGDYFLSAITDSSFRRMIEVTKNNLKTIDNLSCKEIDEIMIVDLVLIPIQIDEIVLEYIALVCN